MVTTWSFVSLVVSSTGRRPWRDRLTGLAAVRVLHGEIESTYVTALSPGPAPARPRWDWETDDDPERPPSFSEVEAPLREFLGPRPLLGPDVRLHLEHLSYELSRLNRPGLDNPALELGSLVDLALPPDSAGEKPSLARLAERLGLPSSRPGDLLGEVRLAARVALRLAAELDAARFPDLPAVLSAADRPSPRPLLEPHRLARLPADPGVYLLRDDHHRPLYVGKARDLKLRVSTYLGHPLAAPRRMDGLAEATAHVEATPTDSDIEASLLEARLIRELRPRYNVQRQVRPPRLFLRVRLGELRPRFAETGQVSSDGATYLGPFRSATAAQRARRLAEAVFELRPPPRPPVDDDFRQRLQSALLFLSGQQEPAITRLQARMRHAARGGEAAELARLRLLLAQALSFSLHDAALSMSPHADTFLAFDGQQAYLVHAARLVTRVAAASLAEAREAVAPALASLSPPSETLDQDAHLVLRWLASRGPGWQVVRL